MKKLLALLAIPVLFACTDNDKVAGVSTVETENAAIDSAFVVRVFNSDSTPAIGLVASLRPAWYVRSIDSSAKDISTEVKTDSMGRIVLKKLPNEKMFLEVISEGEGLFTAINQGDIKKGEVAEFTLEECGSLSGKVDLPEGESFAWVQAYGTDKLIKTDSTGSFKFESLPPAKYRVRTLVSEDMAAIGEGTFDISAGEENKAGKLKKPSDEPLDLWPNTREIEMEEVASDWMLPLADTTVVFVRLDSSFNFSESMKNGNDLRFTDQSGNVLRSKIVSWDDTLFNAKIMVRLEGSEDVESIQMYWGRKASADINDTNIWEGISDSLVQVLNSVTLIDFESGKLESAFKYADGLTRNWYYGSQDTSVVTAPSIDNVEEAFEKDETRGGTVFHWEATSQSKYLWSMIASRISKHPTNLSGLDSASFYAKGKGELGFVFEVLDEPTGKVKYVDTLTGEWKRYSLTPADFEEGDDKYGNKGWDFVKPRTTTLTFWVVGNAEIWLDDIRLYGVNRDDFN